jgi:hypothetical protein
MALTDSAAVIRSLIEHHILADLDTDNTNEIGPWVNPDLSPSTLISTSISTYTNVGIGVVSPTEKLDVAGKTKTDELNISNPNIPLTQSSTGTKGDVSYDDDYAYFATNNNVWRRNPLSTFENRVSFVKSTTYFENTGTIPLTIGGMEITVPEDGTYEVTYNGQFNTTLVDITAEVVIDLNALYLDLNTQTVGAAPMPPFTTGTIIVPGVYHTAAAVAPAGSITLDGGGDSNSIFIFKTDAALGAAVGATFNLTNGASASNIFFLATGAVTLGANCNLSGTIIGSAAVSLGAGAFLNGRALSRSGAIAITSSTIEISDESALFPMGIISQFAIFSSVGALSSTGSSIIIGDVATNSGAITGFGTATLSGTIYQASSGSSLVRVSVYIDSVIQDVSTRERTNSVYKEDIVTSDIISITAGQVVSVKATNAIGISKFHNRILTVKKIEQ